MPEGNGKLSGGTCCSFAPATRVLESPQQTASLGNKKIPAHPPRRLRQHSHLRRRHEDRPPRPNGRRPPRRLRNRQCRTLQAGLHVPDGLLRTPSKHPRSRLLLRQPPPHRNGTPTRPLRRRRIRLPHSRRSQRPAQRAASHPSSFTDKFLEVG